MNAVDLATFVRESLEQIVSGVKAAQSAVAKDGATIHPVVEHGLGRLTEFIEFDVAVTVSESGQKEAGGGIQVFGIGAGAKGKSESVNSTVSRIRFRVPVEYPDGKRP